MKPRAADRVHAWLMLLAAAVTALYWLLYFTSGATQSRADAVYLGFESAFPLADAWMSLAFVLSAILLLRGDRRSVPWGLCAGSAMIYLAAMDLTFDLENDIFGAGMNAEAWGEAVIVACCWLLGPITLIRFWRHPLRMA